MRAGTAVALGAGAALALAIGIGRHMVTTPPPVDAHLVWDNSANPHLGKGVAPPAHPYIYGFGPLCSPALPNQMPRGTFGLLRSGWIQVDVPADLPNGMSAKLFIPGGNSNGVGNGDGPVPFYSGNVPPGMTHKGVGGPAPLPPGFNRHVTFPIPIPMAGTMWPKLIDSTYEGGVTTWHAEGDQYVLSPDQQIVQVGAAFQGDGQQHSVNLFEAAQYGESYVPDGYVLVPFAANVDLKTGSSSAERTGILVSYETGYQLANLGTVARHHVPNNNSIGLYVPPGTAPGPHTTWDPTKTPLANGDNPEFTYEAQEGDTIMASLIALLQLESDPMPWTRPPVPASA